MKRLKFQIHEYLSHANIVETTSGTPCNTFCKILYAEDRHISWAAQQNKLQAALKTLDVERDNIILILKSLISGPS